MLCGTPGTGIHSTRILGFAFWDLVVTVTAAIIIKHWVFPSSCFCIILIVLVLLGIAVHKIIGIKTKLNSLLFLEN